MALPVWDFGDTTDRTSIEIMDVSFAPDIVMYGDTTHMKIKLKNKSGRSITKFYLTAQFIINKTESGKLVYTRPSNGDQWFVLYGNNGTGWIDEKTISWASNAEKTFECDISLNNPAVNGSSEKAEPYTGGYRLPTFAGGTAMYPRNYGINVDMSASGSNDFSISSMCYDISQRLTSDERLHYLVYRDNPYFYEFSGERCDVLDSGAFIPNDEGERLLTSAKIKTATPDAEFLTHGYTVSCEISPNNPESNPISFSVSEILTGFKDNPVAFDYVFNKANNHTIKLILSNGIEMTESVLTLSRAFANVHMSGKAKGGVCLGGFSESTDDNPMFESYFPAYLYGGIEHLNVQRKWVATPTYASGFKAYEGFEPRVTRVGCFVFLDGMITPTASKSTSAAEGVVMATLPEWACPRVRVNLLMQGSTAAVWWLMITPESDGTCTVRIARYRQTNSTSYSSVSSGNQLPITAMWIAADAYPDDV